MLINFESSRSQNAHFCLALLEQFWRFEKSKSSFCLRTLGRCFWIEVFLESYFRVFKMLGLRLREQLSIE